MSEKERAKFPKDILDGEYYAMANRLLFLEAISFGEDGKTPADLIDKGKGKSHTPSKPKPKPVKKSRPMTTSPMCNVSVRVDRLEKHKRICLKR